MLTVGKNALMELDLLLIKMKVPIATLHIARLFSSLISSSLALEAAQRGRAMRTEEMAPVPTYTPSDPTVASEETLKPDLILHTS